MQKYTTSTSQLASLPWLFGDERRLMQVLINLMKNAINFTAKGTITLKVLYDVARLSLVVHVCDTGAGMTLDQLKKLFEDVPGENTKSSDGSRG